MVKSAYPNTLKVKARKTQAVLDKGKLTQRADKKHTSTGVAIPNFFRTHG